MNRLLISLSLLFLSGCGAAQSTAPSYEPPNLLKIIRAEDDPIRSDLEKTLKRVCENYCCTPDRATFRQFVESFCDGKGEIVGRFL